MEKSFIASVLSATQVVTNHCAYGDVVRATKYISPTLIVRGVRTRVGKKILSGNIEVTLTIGKPNYLERDFIKLCKKAGEPFPVKKVQLKMYSPPRKKLKRNK